MKNFILFFLLSIALKLVCAQKNNLATHKIIYTGYIDLNSTTPKSPDLENTVLFNNERAISWNSVTKNFKPHNNDSSIAVVPKAKMLSSVFKDYKTSQMVFEYSSILLKDKNNFYSDDLIPMQWVITNRTKQIDSMECVKALTIFRGRAYSAWFNSNIPVSEGPWKFGGLPGLIIELYDEEKNIYWKLKTFTLSNEEMIIAPQSKGGFMLLKKEFNDGYRKYILANQAEEPVNPSCSTCSKHVEIKVKTIENLVD